MEINIKRRLAYILVFRNFDTFEKATESKVQTLTLYGVGFTRIYLVALGSRRPRKTSIVVLSHVFYVHTQTIYY